MPILPDFDSLGNLPENVYHCSIADLQECFVARFPLSVQRPIIYTAYCQLRQTVESLGINAVQWIDGSFTTRKLDPNDLSQELEPDDIDVLTFVDYNTLNSLPQSGQQLLKSLIHAGEHTKSLFRTHSIGLPVCQPGNQYYQWYEGQRRWYRDIFSRHSPPSLRRPNELSYPYPLDGPRKGIISVTIGNPADAPKISEVRV